MQHLECTMQPGLLRINLVASRTNMANTHQHGEYAPTCILLYLAEWCWRMQVGAYSHVGAYLHVDSYSPFTNADLKGGTDDGGECPSTLPYGIP